MWQSCNAAGRPRAPDIGLRETEDGLNCMGAHRFSRWHRLKVKDMERSRVTLRVRAAGWGLLATGVLAALIVLGSRNLAHFDAALVAYTFATLFAVFGIAYRYAMWLQRPPTRMYWRRGWQAFFAPRQLVGNLVAMVRRAVVEVAANRFIWRRSRLRGLA